MGKVDTLIEAVRTLTPEELAEFRSRLEALEWQTLDAEQIDGLRAALIEGEQSGPPETFDVEAFIRSKRYVGAT